MMMAAEDVENGAILTPYNAQATLIRRLIKSSGIRDKVNVLLLASQRRLLLL